VDYRTISAALAPLGLLARGGFRPEAEDGLPEGIKTAVMVGNAGPDLWQVFARARRDEPDAMNRWTREVLDVLAADLGATAAYPFDGPPWFPFQRWAQGAEPVFPSPIGMLIHPRYGLWHAYRGVLLFDTVVEGVPERETLASPCESCFNKPCLSTCPVDAFGADTYDVPACADHLRKADGRDCLELGCRARRACPVGVESRYLPEQAEFHMRAFRASH
jgi:hypothetical protein